MNETEDRKARRRMPMLIPVFDNHVDVLFYAVEKGMRIHSTYVCEYILREAKKQGYRTPEEWEI